jgi:hypothetical protein
MAMYESSGLLQWLVRTGVPLGVGVALARVCGPSALHQASKAVVTDVVSTGASAWGNRATSVVVVPVSHPLFGLLCGKILQAARDARGVENPRFASDMPCYAEADGTVAWYYAQPDESTSRALAEPTDLGWAWVVLIPSTGFVFSKFSVTSLLQRMAARQQQKLNRHVEEMLNASWPRVPCLIHLLPDRNWWRPTTPLSHSSQVLPFADCLFDATSTKDVQRVLAEIREFLDGRTCDRPSFGVLAHGPTGTGKSNLGLAIALECGVHAFRLSDVGTMSEATLLAAVRLLPDRAVVVIDDCESALGPAFKPPPASGGGQMYQNPQSVPSATTVGQALTTAAILELLDGRLFYGKRVVVWMTTNLPLSSVSEPILRAGRLAAVINLPRPGYRFWKGVVNAQWPSASSADKARAIGQLARSPSGIVNLNAIVRKFSTIQEASVALCSQTNLFNLRTLSLDNAEDPMTWVRLGLPAMIPVLTAGVIPAVVRAFVRENGSHIQLVTSTLCTPQTYVETLFGSFMDDRYTRPIDGFGASDKGLTLMNCYAVGARRVENMVNEAFITQDAMSAFLAAWEAEGSPEMASGVMSVIVAAFSSHPERYAAACRSFTCMPALGHGELTVRQALRRAVGTTAANRIAAADDSAAAYLDRPFVTAIPMVSPAVAAALFEKQAQGPLSDNEACKLPSADPADFGMVRSMGMPSFVPWPPRRSGPRGDYKSYALTVSNHGPMTWSVLARHLAHLDQDVDLVSVLEQACDPIGATWVSTAQVRDLACRAKTLSHFKELLVEERDTFLSVPAIAQDFQ